MRAIPISQIREATREKAAAEALRMSAFLAKPASPGTYKAPGFDEAAAYFNEQAAAYTAKGEPRKRLPAATLELLGEVARLYLAAVASGDKTPARSVEDAPRAAGVPVSERGGRDQVRKWIQRARERGLIPPVAERR